jgi:signal peptidase I
MYPLLRTGDVATIEKCNVASLKIGDVVVFKKENKWIAHRYIKKELLHKGFLITTKGDSRRRIDPPFFEDKFIGKIISFRRGNRIISLSNNFHKILGVFIAKTYKLNTPFFLLNRKFWKNG